MVHSTLKADGLTVVGDYMGAEMRHRQPLALIHTFKRVLAGCMAIDADCTYPAAIPRLTST